MVNACGEVELHVTVVQMDIQTNFLVIEGLPYQVLCGLPFCRSTNMVIDFPRRLAVLQGHHVRVRLRLENDHPMNTPVNTYCLDQVRLPPRTETILAVGIAATGSYLVEPLTGTSKTSCITVAQTLTSVNDGVAFVCDTNRSPYPIMPRGAAVRRATGLHDTALCATAAKAPSHGSREVEIDPELLSEERQQVEQPLGNYAHLFSHTGSTMGRTRLVEHEIDTGASRPVRQYPCQSSTFERNIISKQVARMLQEGVIWESSSSCLHQSSSYTSTTVHGGFALTSGE